MSPPCCEGAVHDFSAAPTQHRMHVARLNDLQAPMSHCPPPCVQFMARQGEFCQALLNARCTTDGRDSSCWTAAAVATTTSSHLSWHSVHFRIGCKCARGPERRPLAFHRLECSLQGSAQHGVHDSLRPFEVTESWAKPEWDVLAFSSQKGVSGSLTGTVIVADSCGAS
jgi:hypothetical protein